MVATIVISGTRAVRTRRGASASLQPDGTNDWRLTCCSGGTAERRLGNHCRWHLTYHLWLT